MAPTLPKYDTPIGVGGAIDTNTGQILTGSLKGQKAGQNDSAVGSTNSYSPAPIALNTLSQPVIPYSPIKPAASTATAGLTGAVGATNDQFTEDLAAATEAAKAPAQSSLKDVITSMLNTPGATQLTANEYAITGVDAAQQELKDVNNQILAEQRAADNEIRAIKENPLGLSTEGVNRQIQDVQDKSTQRQADLAIIQLAKQGKYDSARTIADRAVAAKIERQKSVNDALKLNYEELKSTFTEAEKRQFETAQKDRERKLDTEAYKEKARYEAVIKQSDPLYQAQLAKVRAEAIGSKPTLNGKPQTATQAQVAGYADRTNESDLVISKIGDKFASITAYGGQFLPNFLKSSDRQQYEQAQRNFVNAVLRRESGAVISPSEFANAAQQYFPQPGDSKSVIEQKAKNRQTVIENLYSQGNVQRTVLPGQLIQASDGKTYEVGDDGVTLTEV